MPTNNDLKRLKNLSLNEKILKTQTRILEWCYHWDWNVYVSFSGGKDSTVLLDIVRKIAKEFRHEVPAVFCNTGVELPGIYQFVKTIDNIEIIRPTMNFSQILKEYGYPVISKEVSTAIEYARKGSKWAIRRLNGLKTSENNSKFYTKFYNERFKKYKYLIDAPFKISDKCCSKLKKRPFHDYEKRTGRKKITGLMTEESILRKTSWLIKGCNNFDGVSPSSNPMSFWNQQDILNYIVQNKIPYAKSVYGDIVSDKNNKLKTTKCERTGCAFCLFGIHREKYPNRLQLLKVQYPKMYQYCMENLGYKKVLDFLEIDAECPAQQNFNFTD